MIKTVKVSIVIPVHNAEAFLVEALSSLACQTLQEIEVICVDDGSSDQSASIIRGFVEKDDRFKYYYQENAGAGSARNLGIDHANGEFIVFLDSDDLFEPDMLSEMLEACESFSADVCVCESDRFCSSTGKITHVERFPEEYQEGMYPTSDFDRQFFQIFGSCPWNKMYRRKYIDSLGIRYQNTPNCNDLFFTYMALACSRSIILLKRTFVHYRYGVGSSIQEQKIAHPLCAMDNIGILRNELEARGMLNQQRLRSLDERSLRCFFESFELLSSDIQAAKVVYEAFAYTYEADWCLDDKPLSYFNDPVLRFKYRAYRRLSYEQLMEAYRSRPQSRFLSRREKVRFFISLAWSMCGRRIERKS